MNTRWITGELTLSRILGSRTKKIMFQLKTSEIYAITPLSDITSLEISENNIFYACKKDDSYGVCLAYSSESGDKKALVISAPAKTVNCLKYYRRAVFSEAMLTK